MEGGGDKIGDTPYSAEVQSTSSFSPFCFSCSVFAEENLQCARLLARRVSGARMRVDRWSWPYTNGLTQAVSWLQASYECKSKNSCPHVYGQDPIHNPMNYSPDQCMRKVC